MKRTLTILLCAASALCAQSARQRLGEWSTHSGDPQRTGWQKNETRLTKERMKEFRLLWKLKLDNETRALHSLTTPLVVAALYRDLAVVGGTGDNIYLLDADLGRLMWKKHFEYNSKTPRSDLATWLCPGGLVATPVVAGAGRTRVIYAVSGDGNLHQLSLNDGEEIAPPLPFMPPNGKPYSLNFEGNVVYATTAQRCGGNPNGVYAIDLGGKDRNVSFFPSGSGGFWGLGGSAIGVDGTVYSMTGDGPADPANGAYGTSLVALNAKDLKLKDYYTPSNAEWITKRDLDFNATPVVFNYKGQELLVATTGKEGRLLLLDTKSLGGPDHRTPLYRSSLIANYDAQFDAKGIWGGLASWEATDGARWIVAPIWGPLHPEFKFPAANGAAPNGSMGAFKVEEKNRKPSLAPQWVSRDLTAPAPPVVVNGMVFALSSGEYVRQGGSAEERAKRSTHATLYALDAETGKELYSTGDQITSFTHFAALAVSKGRVFLTTFDNTVYCFGIYMEQ